MNGSLTIYLRLWFVRFTLNGEELALESLGLELVYLA